VLLALETLHRDGVPGWAYLHFFCYDQLGREVRFPRRHSQESEPVRDRRGARLVKTCMEVLHVEAHGPSLSRAVTRGATGDAARRRWAAGDPFDQGRLRVEADPVGLGA